MKVRVRFFSYFRDLAGSEEIMEDLPEGQSVSDLLVRVARRFPKLEKARGCALAAVGLDYAPRDQQLRDGDEVSLFPPVQGG
jgi:molybdopterin synthase sulfur carrier subunit